NLRKKDPAAEMSFVDHLEELRWVLLRSVIAALVGAVVVGFNYKWFYNNIVLAPSRADFVTYKLMCKTGHSLGLGDGLCIEPFKLNLQSNQLISQFNITWTFCFIAGFIIAFPFIFWQFWRFIKPALTEKERKGVTGVIFFVSLLFFSGIAFGYYFLSPYAINFFATFSLSDQILMLPTIADYVDLLMTFTLGCGLAFQLPLVLYFLAKIGIVNARFLKKYFRHAIVIIVIVAAIITPPDGLTQIIVATPLILLYWMSIWIVSRINKRQMAEEEKEWS
ncbi:MAG: twin-arginine translocase subunit TatC, partial [Dinghuibacter sp.]|nr:twin-arginine translocase subunit TatC [Dinghuibacter sp.]